MRELNVGKWMSSVRTIECYHKKESECERAFSSEDEADWNSMGGTIVLFYIGGGDEVAICKVFFFVLGRYVHYLPKINGRTRVFAFVRFLHFEAMQRALKRREELEWNGKRRSKKRFEVHKGEGLERILRCI